MMLTRPEMHIIEIPPKIINSNRQFTRYLESKTTLKIYTVYYDTLFFDFLTFFLNFLIFYFIFLVSFIDL